LTFQVDDMKVSLSG